MISSALLQGSLYLCILHTFGSAQVRSATVMEILKEFVEKRFGPSLRNKRLDSLPKDPEILQQLVLETYTAAVGKSYSNLNSATQGYGGYGNPINSYQPSSPCLETFPNCLFVQLAGFERRRVNSLMDCADFCINSASTLSLACRSFVFNKLNYFCDLYTEADKGKRFYVNGGCICGFIHPSCSTAETSSTPLSTNIILTTTVVPTTSVAPRFCPEGKSPVMERVKEAQVSNANGPIFTGISEQSCYQSCAKDATPTGASFKCLAANYRVADGSCTMLTMAAKPIGTGILNEIPDSVYYDKICLPNAIAERCQGTVERIPQKVLLGFNEVIITTTFTECVEMCLNAQSEFQFVCKSAMYYSAISAENCVLNFEDAMSRPDLFVSESVQTVDYFDFRNC